MRVYIYARVSTDAQAEKGYSLLTQQEACRRKAEEIGATVIIERIDDGYSGANMDRPALQKLLEDVREGKADAIVCFDPDRLSRNPGHQYFLYEEFEKAGVKLVFVTVQYDTSPEGRLAFDVRGAVSAYERAKIRERSMRGKKGKAREGKIVMNTRPTGYGWDAKNSLYVPNEDAKLIRRMFDLVLQGNSITAITKRLNSEGIPSPKGSIWQPSTISRILRNSLYCGEAKQFAQQRKKVDGKYVTTQRDKSEWIIVQCPPIVSREEFDKVQEEIARHKKFSPRNTKGKYLLSNIAKCGVCGKTMYVTLHGSKHYYYVCSSQRRRGQTGEEACSNRGVRVSVLDEQVLNLIKDLVVKPSKLRKLLAEKKFRSGSKAILERLQKGEDQLLSRRKKILDQFILGRINETEMDNAFKQIQNLLTEIRLRREEHVSLANFQSLEERIGRFVAAVQNAANQREACIQTLSTVFITRTDTNKGRYAKPEIDVRIVPR